MKNLITIIAILITLSINAQDQYSQGMQKAFGLWKENKTTEAVALFERIAQAEKDNWIPSYYAANVLITSAFQTKDQTAINGMLEKANGHIAKAHKLSPNNSEITTLEGLMYTGYVAMDPGTYGMKYSGKIMALHEEAVALDKNNPRAMTNLIGYEIGSARFFGTELSTFCDRLQKVIPMFENQRQDTPFAPSSGIGQLQGSIKECGC